jgi:hypothetical protein
MHFKNWFSIAAALFFCHFLFFSLVGLFEFLLIRNVHVIFNTASSISWHLLISAYIEAIHLGFVPALTWALTFSLSIYALNIRVFNCLTRLHLFSAGLLAYILFSALFYLRFPGLLVGVPIVNRLPFLCLLISILLFVIFLLFLWHHYFHLRSWSILALFVAFMLLPHGLFRMLPAQMKENKDPVPRCFFFVMDAARYDTAHDLLGNRVQLGFSDFQSTRKQYFYLLNDNHEEAADRMFLPTIGEPLGSGINTPWAKECLFLINDSGTVSPHTINFGAAHHKGPSFGLKHIFFSNSAIPIALWFDNFASSIETNNAVSDRSAFYEDSARGLNDHRLVFAHSCWLEDPAIYKFEELLSFAGWNFLMDMPIFYKNGQFRNGSNITSLLYRYKMQLMLNEVLDLVETFKKRYISLQCIVTSDHGQNFHENDRFEYFNADTSPSHGFNADPSCSWIPVIFCGNKNSLETSTTPISWLDFRSAIYLFFEDHAISSILPSRIHKMGYAIAIPGSEAEGNGILGVSTVMKRVVIADGEPRLNIDKHQLFPCYYLRCLSRSLIVFNPISSTGKYSVKFWDGYNLVMEEIIAHGDMNKALSLTCSFTSTNEVINFVKTLPSHASP